MAVVGEQVGADLSRQAVSRPRLCSRTKSGLAFLLGRRRSILADDMGLGKTRQSIHGLTQAAPQGPYLIICPASVKRNWEREILAVLPGAETHVGGPDPPPQPGYRAWSPSARGTRWSTP